MSEIDFTFAKVVTSPDERDHILVEGQVISLEIRDIDTNNLWVDRIVHALRSHGRLTSEGPESGEEVGG